MNVSISSFTIKIGTACYFLPFAHDPVWKISIHYTRHPTHWCAELGRLLHWVCTGLHQTWHTRNCAWFIGSTFKNILLTFLVTSKILLTFLTCWHLCFFSHFLDLFGLVSPVTCAEKTLCTENSATLWCQIRCKLYYLRRMLPEILSAIMLLGWTYSA